MELLDTLFVREIIAGLVVAAILFSLSRAYRWLATWWRTQSDEREERFDGVVERGANSEQFQLHLGIFVAKDSIIAHVGFIGAFLLLMLAHIHMQLGDEGITERVMGGLLMLYTLGHYIKSTERAQLYKEINRRTEVAAGMPDEYLLD